MIKLKFFLIVNYKKYQDLNKTSKILVLKKGIKCLQNLFYILIIYYYLPEEFLYQLNLDDNEKMILMAFFVVVSSVMSYILQNYQCKPPGTYSAYDNAQNIDIYNHPSYVGAPSWKQLLIRILWAMLK